jgi:phosphatidylinositol 4-phosphatase
MKYENLSKLLRTSSVSLALNQFDFFHAILDKSANFQNLRHDLINLEGVEVITLQKGVFRVNCIDCLDRTNVVQTVFARNILHKMLHKLSLCEEPTGDPFEGFNPVFEERFKNIWADHGDLLSLAYSGTGALKSDFVRKGKRSLKGNIDDGINSCKRFVINNFIDGHNQDCHDFFLMKLNPKKDNLKEHSTKNVKIITPTAIILAISLYYFSIGLALPADYEDNLKKKLLRLLIFLGIFYLTFRMIFKSVKKMIISTPTLDSS